MYELVYSWILVHFKCCYILDIKRTRERSLMFIIIWWPYSDLTSFSCSAVINVISRGRFKSRLMSGSVLEGLNAVIRWSNVCTIGSANSWYLESSIPPLAGELSESSIHGNGKSVIMFITENDNWLLNSWYCNNHIHWVFIFISISHTLQSKVPQVKTEYNECQHMNLYLKGWKKATLLTLHTR